MRPQELFFYSSQLCWSGCAVNQPCLRTFFFPILHCKYKFNTQVTYVKEFHLQKFQQVELYLKFCKWNCT